VTVGILCSLQDCPVAADGQCLEGFGDPRECPNSSELAAGEDSSVDDEADEDEFGVDLAGGDTSIDEALESAPSDSAWISLGGDRALTPEEADLVARNAPCRLVLVAGEFESGKTTLVVELYAQFLRGPFAGATFGGSHTLRALDARHHPARVESGEPVPVTDRTGEEDMRLVHLRIQREARVHNLLFSDVRGEFFENIIDGAAVSAEVPLAGRANVCLLLIDGAGVANVLHRQSMISRAQLLIAGLTEPGGLRDGTPVMILLTKGDLLSADVKAWASSHMDSLSELAARRHLVPRALIVAARPLDSAQFGLEEVLDGVLPAPPDRLARVVEVQPGDRQFWIQPEVVP